MHASGIFPALAEDCARALEEALVVARRFGATVSFDLNYRSALCTPAEAAVLNQRLVGIADVLIGSPEGLECLLGDAGAGKCRPVGTLAAAVRERFPGLRIVAGTCRTVHSASRNDLSGFLLSEHGWVEDPGWPDLGVVDRVGTGDAFSAGLIHGVLSGWAPPRTLRFALTHAALVHTTRGDTSQFTAGEVEVRMTGTPAAMQR